MKNRDRLQPWSENPRYWQYKSEPVLLLGGSKTDHIFLAEELESHLAEMSEVGANYVRCTMSQREGTDLKPHRLLPDGTFNIELWNEDYWTRFANMLRWTAEREIFVQIEVWDRFDYSRNHWEDSPWNPGMNVNYTFEETGFEREYPRPSPEDRQPFFHSIPGMALYDEKLDLIREHQEKFVDKMLSYSLEHGHVLYCMNNETSTPAAWGQHWIEFIKIRAQEKGVIVFATDMWDDGWKGKDAEHSPIIFSDPEHYMFADISQVNSRNFDDGHWEAMQWLVEQVNSKYPRPCNNTKIYGGGYTWFGTGANEDGIERFWRNILGGCASSRFHRPNSGNGLNERARGCIMAVRELEQRIKLWDVEPHMALLKDRRPNTAYLAAKPGEQYALYFTHGGSVGLDLSDDDGEFGLTWISVTEGRVYEPQKAPEIRGGGIVKIDAPFKGGWVAAIVKK